MKNRKLEYKDVIFYIIVIFIAVCLPNLFTQIITEGQSDIGPHTDFALVLLDKNPELQWGMPVQAYTYPLYHLTLKIFLTALLGNKVIAASVLLSLCSVFSILITRYCLKKMMTVEKLSAIENYMIDVISICSIFFIGITGVLTEGRYYLGQGAPNLWHNPTYIMMRPFCWMYFLYAIAVIKGIHENQTKKSDFVVWGILGLVVCLIKPSFPIVLLPAMAVLTICEMIRKKALQPGFLMLGSVSASVFILIIQFVFTQTNPLVKDTSEPFSFAPGSYYGFNLAQSIGVILALNGVLLLYLMVEGRKHLWKDFYDTAAVLITMIGMLQFFFLSDGSAGNFAWGYYMAVNIGTIISLVQCLKYKKKILFGICSIIFLYQVLMGMLYLLQYYRGGDYLI